MDIHEKGVPIWSDNTIELRFKHGHPICPDGLDLIDGPLYYQVSENCFLYKYHTKEMKHAEMITLNEKGATDYALGLSSS